MQVAVTALQVVAGQPSQSRCTDAMPMWPLSENELEHIVDHRVRKYTFSIKEETADHRIGLVSLFKKTNLVLAVAPKLGSNTVPAPMNTGVAP